jgi:hypothetical protein
VAFYLQTNQSFQMDGNPPYSTHDLVLPSYGPSKPLSEAEDDVATLRHLARLTDTAILAGNVERIGATYDHLDPTPVPNRKIIAKGVSGIEYVAFTNSNGHFEFDLPPDTYDVTADAEPGLREAERSFPRGSTHLEKQACLDVDFTMLRDGKLAGQVRTSRGKPARFVKVAIIPIAPAHPQFAVVTDEQGPFEVGGRQPGSYLVGVGLLAQIGSPEWQSRVYFPGVPTREQAKVIELGDGEWRTDIDFELPRSMTR